MSWIGNPFLGSPLWNQRYWVNMEHYQEGGPAFIHIGGEAEARPTWLEFGLWHTLAEQHNAALFILEHRYYGKSEPTSDMSTENMKYLSSRQALEDLGRFCQVSCQETFQLIFFFVSNFYG